MNKGCLPSHIDPADVDNAIATLEALIVDNREMVDALEVCNLQPTSRAAWLAAQAAVSVLLAHEIGQEVGQNPELEPVGRPEPVYEDVEDYYECGWDEDYGSFE